MRKVLGGVVCAALVACGMVVTLKGHQTSGAIFTTIFDGSEVNFNIYAAKEDVYLDGGPGPGAPQGAAGLDDGVYVFMVTDPSGKALLSTDAAGCRLFRVTSGIITQTVPPPPNGCGHVTGTDVDHGALTIQLMPYLDTPNNGGEYKVWATYLEDYVCNADLSIVDCGSKKGSFVHGFYPRHSKTDNYKVRGSIREIDTRFHGPDGSLLDGLGVLWTDTLGASNQKWSYLNVALNVNHEAHVEAVEDGAHQITIANQAGCFVGDVFVNGKRLPKSGPQTVTVKAPASFFGDTVFIDVWCQ